MYPWLSINFNVTKHNDLHRNCNRRTLFQLLAKTIAMLAHLFIPLPSPLPLSRKRERVERSGGRGMASPSPSVTEEGSLRSNGVPTSVPLAGVRVGMKERTYNDL